MTKPRMIFMTGTGTDVGKTVVTAALLRLLSRNGREVFGLKPLQTGCVAGKDNTLRAPDVVLYNEACPQGQHSALYCYRPACSPHLAAQEAGKTHTARQLAQDIVDAAQQLPSSAMVCVEGSGGIMVPINGHETFLDVMAALDIPVLLVCPNELGTINHSLLSWRALQSRGICLLGFVMTRTHKQEKNIQPNTPSGSGNSHVSRDTSSEEYPEECINEFRMLADNRIMLENFCQLPCLGELPWLENLHSDDADLREKDWDKAASCLQPVLKALLRATI